MPGLKAKEERTIQMQECRGKVSGSQNMEEQRLNPSLFLPWLHIRKKETCDSKRKEIGRLNFEKSPSWEQEKGLERP